MTILIISVSFGAGCSGLLGISDPVVVGGAGRDDASVDPDAPPTTPGDGALEAGGPTPCVADGGGLATLCDDFERVDLRRGPWDSFDLSTDANAMLVPGRPATSPMGAEDRVLEASATSALGSALLTRNFAVSARRISYELEASYERLPTRGGYFFARTAVVAPDTQLEMTYIYADNSGVWFVQQRSGTPSAYARSALVAPPGSPHRFAVSYEVDGSIRVLVDGALQDVPSATAPFLRAGPPRFAIGVGGVEPDGSGFVVRLDDVRFQAD